jgi:peptidoglycan hydrolase-like protein with peptidoglycan-binding domain
MKTNHELVTYALSLIGSGYVYGVNGKIVTEALIQAKADQYPDHYDGYKIVNGQRISYIDCSRKWIGKMAYDCSSISDLFTGNDKSANGWLAAATVKGKINLDPDKGPIVMPPNRPGIELHSDEHMGIYLGDEYVVQARGVLYGVVKTKIEVNNWTDWCENPFVDYSDDSPVISTEPETTENEIPEGIIIKETKPKRTLYLGCRGDDVVWVQNRLIKAGFTDIGLADGRFGPKTDTGVRDFQKKFFLDVDGKVGPKTLAKLVNPVIPVSPAWVNPYARPSDSSSFSRGSRGKGVIWIQAILKRAGYPVSVDGSFGPITEREVRNFQRKNNLAVDGIVWTKTLAKLDTYNK